MHSERRETEQKITSTLSPLTQTVLLTAFYFVGGMLGRLGAFGRGEIALVWPPAGIALAAVLIFGYRFWPGVAAGALLFSLVDGKPFGFFTMATAIGNTMSAVTCVYLMDRLVGSRGPITKLAHATGFIIAVAMGACINAAFNVVGLVYSQVANTNDLLTTTLSWWVPNALGSLIMAPLISAWTYRTRIVWDQGRAREALGCGVGLIFACSASFNSWIFHGISSYPVAFLPYPFLVWAALRFGLRGAMTCNLFVAASAIAELLHGRGPFYTGNETTSLMLVGSYIGVASCLSLLLAAGAQQRDDAEDELTSREKQYRAVVEDQSDLICRFDAGGTLTFVNGAYCRYYDRTREQLLGSNFFDELREEDREVPLLAFRGLTTNQPFMTFDNKTKIGGRTFWQQCTVHAFFDEKNQLKDFQAVIQDVTERKESEERLKAILNTLVAGVVVVSPEGKIIQFNPAAERIFGRDLIHVIGQPLTILFSKSDFDIYQDYLEKRAKQPRRKFVEISALLPDGNAIPIELAVTDELINDQLMHILLVRDIYDRKQLEIQSQKMEAIGQLTGGIAHDFNNLTQAILGYSAILNERLPKGDSNRETVQQIRKAVEQASSLTRQLLTFSRKQEPQRRVIAINDVVADMNSLLKRWIGANIRLRLSLSQNPIYVSADAGQLQQVLMNLAINARDAMFGTGQLTINTEAVTIHRDNLNNFKNLTSGEYVVLRVADTGCGMTPEVKARIFEAFFTTKEVGKGTGLGLSIVHSIVQQSGGEIVVDSTPGIGTTFNVYLPRAADEHVELHAAASQQPAGWGTETILLVEDEELVREMFEAILEAKGYNVLTAGDGLQALKVSNTHQGRIDLIVTDMTLPELSGWELADRIAKARGLTPTLYISGYSNEEIMRKYEFSGPIDFLQKPFAPETLLTRIRNVLSRAQVKLAA
jgi:two-component system, cell cycle sensor histidine kinase and response regulator CckA